MDKKQQIQIKEAQSPLPSMFATIVVIVAIVSACIGLSYLLFLR